jgi:ribosomal protein S18 acetylase RimI-like enzyme
VTVVVGEEEATGRIVGAIVFGPDSEVADQYRIHSLGVVPDRRRQGIAERLKVAALAEIAAVAGRVQNVFSEVHKNNLAMLGLNDKLDVKRAPDPENRAHFLSAIAVEPADDGS